MGTPPATRWSSLNDNEAVEAWNRLPASTGWGASFSTSDFLEAVASAWGAGTEQITVFDGNSPVAAARLVVRRRFGTSYSVVPPFTAYSAVRIRDDLKESEIHGRSSALEPLLGEIEERFPAVDMHLPPAVQDLRVFSWRGWMVRPLYTYFIELDSAHDPLGAWSESARRIARQHRTDFEIVDGDPETQARLVADSYGRGSRQTPLAADRLADAIQKLCRSGSAQMRAARNLGSGEIDASVTVLKHQTEAYYWAAGGQPGPAMTVLLATLLPELIADGVKLFDFVGANTASIAEFKRRFGGRLTIYYRAAWRRGLVGRLFGRGV